MGTKTAVILAGGKGSRLHKFETIKPLVKVGGKPLVLWNIEYLQEFGVKKIYIVVDTNDTLTEQELLGSKHIKTSIVFIRRKKEDTSILDTFRTVSAAVKEPFFLTVCDIIFERNPYKYFLKKNLKQNTISVLISNNSAHNKFSGAQVKARVEAGKISTVGRNLPRTSSYEAGIYHFGEKTLAPFLRASKKKSDVLLEQYISKGGEVSPVLMPNDIWFDVNDPATLIRAELFVHDVLHNDSKQDTKPTARYKKLPKTFKFRYNKPLGFEITIKHGILDRIGEFEVIPHERYYSPHYIIVDKNILKLYGRPVLDQLRALGYRVNLIVVNPGEWSKSTKNYLSLAEKILASGIDKKSVIISIGGGVIKDLSGFLASTLYRGIGFISIPTTVLSQCDAAITLKQGVNGEGGKNLLGSYYPPIRILVDPAVLVTLGDRYVSDGLAECLKQAFAQDKNYFKFFDEYKGSIRNIDFLEKAITKSIQLKIPAFEKDFYEDNVALVYQYGHEVGHAVEFLSGYKIGHGEAVSIGMRVSAEVSRILGVASQKTVDNHIRLLSKYKLPVHVPSYISPEDIVNTLRYNKKFHGDSARLVLVKEIGSLWNSRGVYYVSCDSHILKKALTNCYAKEK